MNFILRISNEIKWKMKIMFVTRSIIDEFHSTDTQGDLTEGESSVNRIIFDELHSSDIETDEMEAESGLTRSFIDEIHFWDIIGGQ